MTNYNNEIEFCTFLIASENDNYTFWNNRGFFKMQKAIDDNNINLLRESINDLKIAINYCQSCNPAKIYFIAEANIQTAMTQLASFDATAANMNCVKKQINSSFFYGFAEQ